jgi:hypothetical protein
VGQVAQKRIIPKATFSPYGSPNEHLKIIHLGNPFMVEKLC